MAAHLNQFIFKPKIKVMYITKMENEILRAIGKDIYAEPGYSDVSLSNLRKHTGFENKTLRGVLGSLVQKEVIWIDDRMTEIHWGSNKAVGTDPEMHIINLNPPFFSVIADEEVREEWIEVDAKGIEQIDLVVK